jgi:ankyrin repeat protein
MPLFRAATNEHVHVVRLLSENRVNLGAQDSYGKSALERAARRCNYEIVQLFFEKGFFPTGLPLSRMSPVVLAAIKGDYLGVQLLLEKDVPKAAKEVVLLNAAMKGHGGIIKLFLLFKVVAVNASSMLGKSTLDFAALKGHVAVVRLLLKELSRRDQLENRLYITRRRMTECHWTWQQMRASYWEVSA